MSRLNLPEWHVLEKNYNQIVNKNNQEKTSLLFSLETQALTVEGLYQQANEETKKFLLDLAEACQLSQGIEDLFNGEKVNVSENRPALHTSLREKNNIAQPIYSCLERMKNISEKIRNKAWFGYTGKPIQDVLHIGIGGSDLSQRLTCDALVKYANASVNIHFVSNIDPEDIENILKKLDPETTLVIVASKSFSTLETKINLDRTLEWFNDKRAVSTQVIAITARPEKVLEQYAVLPENILPLWDWVGGRYSIWSAMGFVLMVAIGYENFRSFLDGANAMDEHFRNMSFEQNIPVMLGLMSIWNINFFHCQTHAIIPYSHRLSYLLPHLQQLDMESNGKSVTVSGQRVDYKTGAILWGGVGSNSQHSFHQLLHQGTHITPIDFIIIQEKEPQDVRVNWLNANCQAQIQALQKNGRSFINLIKLKGLTPYTLGALIAMYEHKVFVQSRIWNINPFDQLGVELAKILAQEIMSL